MQVCYVSGDPDARRRVATALEAHEGVTVEVIPDADAARARLDDGPVDCVVIGHAPPETDAPSVVEAVSAETDAPAVVFTDRGDERVASDAFAAGAVGFLRDDGPVDTLVARLRDLAGADEAPPADEDSRAPADEDSRAPADEGDRARMFSTLVSNLPGLVYRCRNEPGWPMSFVSDGARELTGYAPERIESGAVSWGEDVIHPGDREAVYDDVQDAVDAGEAFTLTYRIETADGDEKWVWEQGRPVSDPVDGEPVLEGFITDITERREHERRLEAIFDGTFQFMGLMEPDGTVIEANEAALDFGGVDRDAVVGKPVWETHWFRTPAADTDRLRQAVERAADGEFVRYDMQVQGVDELRTVDFSIRPITDAEGTVTLLVPEGRDITELKRREEQLEALNDLAGTLTDASDAAEICEAAVEAAAETLDLELAAVERYDEASGALVPCARTDALADLIGEDALFAGERGEAWQTYVEAEGTVFEDVTARSDIQTTGTPLDSAIVLPLGRHGVFVTGSTTPEAFSDPEIDLARILAAHTETAFDRLDREHLLQERTESLERRTDRLERANRLTETLRNVVDELCAAPTRDAAETGVCRQLVEQLPVAFAWVGAEDPVSGELVPGARAGVEDGYLDALAPSTATETEDPEPSVGASRRQDPVLVDEVRVDPPMAQWRQEALVRSFRTVLAVPITHAETRYGVLTVYGEDAAGFGDREREALATLGRLVGYVLTATERKRSLSTDSVVELEFQVTDPGQGVFALLADLGGPVEFRGLVSEGDRPLRVFLTHETAEAETVRAAAEAAPGVSEAVERTADGERTHYEVRTAEGGPLATLVEYGARVRDLTVTDRRVRFVVELSDTRDVREFAETVERGPVDATLVARRERAAPRRDTAGFREEILAALTDRQREALKTAYLAGFFESPRAKTGEEVASMLDVSQPTLNRHLRAGQRTVFTALFDE